MASKRTSFTCEQKLALIKYKEENPESTRQQLADYCKEVFDKTPSLPGITKILQNASRLKAEVASRPHALKRAKLRPSPVAELEAALIAWIGQREAQNCPLTDQVLIEGAIQLGKNMQLPSNFNYSRKWLLNFKQRYGIKRITLHGEAASVNQDTVVKAREYLPQLLQLVSPEDLYNFDETALFYETLPTRTLASRQRPGVAQSKKTMTIGLCCNAAGTDKLRLTVIGHAK
eukprot:m.193163 g.193163  ORF g.193163 m.193163 type:complete len:231 (+) comp16777_c0_seq1:207-899(+)